MKIAIFSFGNYGIFLRHVVSAAKALNREVEWSVIASSYQAVSHFNGVVTPDKIHYLFEDFNRVFDETSLSDYEAIAKCYYEKSSLWRALAADKVHYKKRDKNYQIRHAMTVYKLFKSFLLADKPDYVLFPIIESHDGYILYDLSKELGIEPIVYAHGRTIGGSYFSDSYKELLPRYADRIAIDKGTVQRASAFLESFRKEFKRIRYGLNNYSKLSVLPSEAQPAPYIRLFRNIKASCGKEKHNLKINYLIKILVFFQKYNYRFRALKYSLQQRLFDVKHLDDLPAEFVFFPLQFSPESSINVPSPYYIDQTRVIDEVLFNHSNGMQLVVKEHPAMMGARSNAFYAGLRRTPGLLTADAGLPSYEIAKRAKLVVSVTGSAVLETFLMGRPSLQLGDNFLKPYLRKGSPSDEEIVSFVSKVMACSSDFILYSPNAYGFNREELLNTDNISRFTQHLFWHIDMIGQTGFSDNEGHR